MDVKKALGFERVDAHLDRLEKTFDISNPIGSRANATLLGRELGELAWENLGMFKLADARLTQILGRLLDGQMGAVAGAVERTFHERVGEAATDVAVLRANTESKKVRGT
jgi:hypothetical protein